MHNQCSLHYRLSGFCHDLNINLSHLFSIINPNWNVNWLSKLTTAIAAEKEHISNSCFYCVKGISSINARYLVFMCVICIPSHTHQYTLHFILATANVELLMCVLKTKFTFTCMWTSLFVVYRRFFGFSFKNNFFFFINLSHKN